MWVIHVQVAQAEHRLQPQQLAHRSLTLPTGGAKLLLGRGIEIQNLLAKFIWCSPYKVIRLQTYFVCTENRNTAKHSGASCSNVTPKKCQDRISPATQTSLILYRGSPQRLHVNARILSETTSSPASPLPNQSTIRRTATDTAINQK